MKGRNKRRKIRPIRRKPKMSPVRKEFYKRLLYSVGCLGILFLLMDEDGVGAFIALTFFLIAMLQLVYLAILAQEVIDDFFPIKQMHQGKKTRLSKGIYYVACAVFLGSAVTQVFAVKIIDNTIKFQIGNPLCYEKCLQNDYFPEPKHENIYYSK